MIERNRIQQLISLMVFVVLFCLENSLFAAEATKSSAKQIEFFELHIRPVLIEKCADCHTGDEDAESALAISSRSALIKGGDFGPAIVPGKPEQSLLYQSIQRTHKELKMPPDVDEKLNKATIQHFKRWIEWGAPWPEEKTKPLTKSQAKKTQSLTTSHWCFLTRQAIAPPEVNNPQWSRSPIDRFIYSRLQKEKLTPAHLASRRILIRRASFDLTGLPPTPEEVQEFLDDPDTDLHAFSKVIDRLLASPAYGERWGRHWLDVARYADTQGDVGDFPIPGAYLYRNWVIDAFNTDLPYDKFLQAQLAGDILAKRENDPQRARQLKIATGFIALSRRFGNTRFEDQHLTIDDTIDTIGRGIMGVTLKCARCHDHKFDPMLATDYYGLYGIFESTLYPTMGASNSPSPTQLVSAENNPESQQKINAYWDLLSHYQHQIRNHFRPWLKPTLKEYAEVAKKIKSAKKEDQSNEKLEARRQKLLASHKGKFRELMEHGLPWLKQEKARLVKQPPAEMLYAVIDGKPHHAKLHRRGNPSNPGEVVPRQFINVISKTKPHLDQKQSGREELANWITDPAHPLTARVIVNRLWYYHFGQGLVKTVDNLGVLGAAPSHPQLLDYLANQLIEQGWSLKALHRQMLLSRAYRLDSKDILENSKRDPENVFLWKFTRKRLDAESIRDAMLFVSGELDRQPGGPHPFKPWHKKGYSLNGPFHEVFSSKKRSVYLMTQRLYKHPFLGLFNGPDTNETTGTRKNANIPTQALFLMNSPFVPKLAEAFARRILQTETTEEKQIKAACQIAFSRNPTPTEKAEFSQTLDAYRRQLLKEQSKRSAEVNEAAWTGLCKVLLTTNEFFFID
ncbi:PSD1 and planctomycete cytochrome C domain-containing protein [Gimesia aquarii]|uniref:Planctomycete cytochrome C n=1 Tax=Gimesia aquarii TaxID=2527964 RepID=A0A517W0C4_9PLAN|nr:PSD1 and planctomycete cytochrome C domain-containing protein [Gimesia aquarii]QDT98702.1 Planctomycete cytochrome C [Gimesia aquarii]